MKNKEAILAFGLKVREIRLQKGYSLQEFADDADMSKGTIYKIENGQMNPSLDVIISVAKVLDVKIEELIQVI